MNAHGTSVSHIHHLKDCILFSERLASVKPSPSMAAKAKVDALRAQGRKVIDFTIGEPDFDTAPHIIEGGINALKSGQTRYTASAGTPALRAAIARKLERENQLSFRAEEIVVGCGAKHIIYNAFAASLNEGDEVIVPAPFWVSYPDMVALQAAKPVIVACSEESGFKLSADVLAKAITPRARWVILNTPNNPTGAVYTREELEAICDVLRAYPQVWLMTDEIYEHFVYNGVTHVSPLQIAPDLRERTLLVNGLSKAYAFTGWRIGYGAGPVELVKRINLLLTQSTTCASAMSQAAAVVALDGPQECVAEAAHLFESRRNRVMELIAKIPGLSCMQPDGAFYVFVNVQKLLGLKTVAGNVLQSDVDVMNFFIEQAGVAVIDGTSYGCPGFLRMSFATSMEEIEAGYAAIAQAVAACKA
ncbi:pyridoxal phosphate-dependent aminotransferase [Diaphorobacter ruginosibacter]|uniref:Aminotransferase n=2 Tax=Diaphorobacter ruginosibacter TaxID=1715720 RepID=A0A7G9RVE3_9BURK|nr:pyridoxal phosphate-dependent aminotransferase [Diaphorobacter ruginosibacter]